MGIQETTDIPEVKETIVKLRELSADEKVRQEAYYREKQLHDEASALKAAERKGKAEGALLERCSTIRNLLSKGKTYEEVSELLGYPVSEIKSLAP